MKSPALYLFGWLVTLWVTLPGLNAASPPPPDPLYTKRAGSPDGMGKWFMGREIAHYMTHHGASWLERPEREEEERPRLLLDALALKPGQAVADVGAGSGYLTWRMAERVGPTGKVYATDIQPEMLLILSTNMTARGFTNVVPILSTPRDPHLPTNTLDLIVLVDVYHECEFPYEMARGMASALKPGGRLVFVEYRGEDRWVPIKRLHKMTEAQVRTEMALHDLEWVSTGRELPRQHILIFRRPMPADAVKGK
jgi:precorrin-6B methylase 2